MLLREPGGVAVAERIRELVKDPGLAVVPRAEALLYAAARAQLVAELVSPALERRALGAARPLRRLLARLPGRRPRAGRRGDPGDQRVRDGRACGRPHAAARPRRRRRARAARRPRRAPDRLEREADAFFEAIGEAYASLAAADGGRVRTLDAELAPEQLVDAALAELADLIDASG